MRFVAGRGAVAELLTEGAAAKSHREDAAGRGAVAELLAGALWRKQLARAAGENSRWKQPAEKQPGNSHLTEQARSVNLANQAQGVILAELVRLSFWQTRS